MKAGDGMPYNKTTFSENLNHYLKLHGENQSDLCELCGVSSSTASGWCNGTIMPRMDKVQKIADHFGCRLSDLVENHSLPEESERQQRLEEIADEIKERTRFIKTVVDSTYNFYSSLGALIGLPEPVPHEIALKPQQSSCIERDIKSLVEKFLATATPEEKENFWLKYDKIGQELRKQMEHPEETPYPTPEEIETYGELAGNLADYYFHHATAKGPQSAPPPQESTDTTPPQGGPETPSEGPQEGK